MRKRKRTAALKKIIVSSRGEDRIDRNKGIYELKMEDASISKAEVKALDKRDGMEVYLLKENPGCLYIPALGPNDAKTIFERICK